MTRSSGDLPTQSPEVRAYMKRLLAAIFVGIVVMATTAIWAWNTYGKKLDEAPPLPSGTPPFHQGPGPNFDATP